MKCRKDGCPFLWMMASYTQNEDLERQTQYWDQHQELVHQIFDILEQHDLYIKLEKCTFEQEEIKYLGVIIGKGKL
jgi:hypothetical protein